MVDTPYTILALAVVLTMASWRGWHWRIKDWPGEFILTLTQLCSFRCSNYHLHEIRDTLGQKAVPVIVFI